MKISVIIPFHLNENQPYLDRCLKSLEKQEGIDFEVLVVSSAKEKPSVPDWVKFIDVPEKPHFAAKINQGMKDADPDSTHFIFGNDDTIYGKNALKNFPIEHLYADVIINPLSNCDNGAKYMLPKLQLPIQATHQEMEPYLNDLMNFDTSMFDVIIPTDYVCFYATLVKRTIVDKIGMLDETFKTGWEDHDYCLKARKEGILSVYNLSSFVFHYGGKSAKGITDEDKRGNEQHFKGKWIQ